jgi:hypothetical protein
MRIITRGLVLVAVLGSVAFTQDDSQSLGDVARQTRQQKQQKSPAAKDTSAPVKTSKVITNDEMPSHSSATSPASSAKSRGGSDAAYDAGSEKKSADHWRSQIQAQKTQINALQSDIDRLNESIHFAPGNCVANCVQWNERQVQKQQQVDAMKSQLEDARKTLETMQDAARQQGYGSSVYDP